MTLDLYRFPLAWAGVLAALHFACLRRHGRSPLSRASDWIWAACASALFWDGFELVNLRLQNWWYVGISQNLIEASIFGFLSFATVLPAVRLGDALLSPAGAPRPERARPGAPLPLALAGLAMLALALAFPNWCFAFAWLFLWPICEALVALFPAIDGAPTPLQSLHAGDGRRLWRLALLGILLGLVWESLNWKCPRGWVYTVPHFPDHKLFEMPLPGYLGYIPFAFECAAGLALVDRVRQRLSRRATLGAVAALFVFHFALELFAFPDSTLSHASLQTASLDPAERRMAEVAHMGGFWAGLLRQAGVRTPEELAQIDPAELHRRIAPMAGASPGRIVPPERVVQMWIHAARRDLR